MSKPTIIFEKWRDPMVPEDLYDEIYPPDKQDYEGDDYESVRRSFNDEQRPQTPYRGLYFSGPIGIIPLNETNLPGKRFNFWVGHTNFELTKNHLNLMNKVPGVEVLRIHTRYRMWFAIAKAFNENDVMRDIEKALIPSPPAKEISDDEKAAKFVEGIEALQKIAEKKYKGQYWAIIKTEKGYAIIGDKTLQATKNKLGDKDVIVSSWDEKGSDEETK